jgi:hypothetical protein
LRGNCSGALELLHAEVILVTNLPLIWSLLRDVFPALKSWTGGSKRGTDRYKSGPWTSKGGSKPSHRHCSHRAPR